MLSKAYARAVINMSHANKLSKPDENSWVVCGNLIHYTMQFDYQNTGVHLTVPKCCHKEWRYNGNSHWSRFCPRLNVSLHGHQLIVWEQRFKILSQLYRSDNHKNQVKHTHSFFTVWRKEIFPHKNISKSLNLDKYLRRKHVHWRLRL